MSVLVFDMETTGLLRRGSQLHCIGIRDAEQETCDVYDYHSGLDVTEGVERLANADALVGHNIVNFDIPMLQELFPGFTPKGTVIDTLVLSRLYYANIQERDFEKQPAGMPIRLYGSHSLAAWGYRLKVLKGDYGKQSGAWETYSPEMKDYMVQDVEVTTTLWALMERRLNQ